MFDYSNFSRAQQGSIPPVTAVVTIGLGQGPAQTNIPCLCPLPAKKHHFLDPHKHTNTHTFSSSREHLHHNTTTTTKMRDVTESRRALILLRTL